VRGVDTYGPGFLDLSLSMSTPLPAPIDDSSLRRYNYIDDTPLEHSEDSSEGDDDLYSEDLDDTRVEDEDWEIAERGRKILSYGCEDISLIFFSTRLYQTIQSSTAIPFGKLG
jgi:hypothetical protein